jgi:peptidoglycan lytic transglycosylase G
MNKIFSAIVVLTMIFGITYWQYGKDIGTPIDESSTESISFTIKKGTPIKEIGKNLEEKGLISSSFNFYLYTKFNSLGENLIAGRFLLSKSMNMKEIVTIISDPSQAEFIITIQEGLRIRDIDQKLVELELIEEGEFLEEIRNFDGWEYYDFLDQETLSMLDLPVEGYLYPDTYFLDPGDFQPHDLIYTAMDNFENKTAELLPEIKKHSIHEIITMASIIENEVFGLEDRKIVSGILWKRLESGWKLDADATLLYITDDRKIDAADLKIDSPYNSRKFTGLPPGPISNPSLESIEAAMYPVATGNWFYLNTLDTGEVIYATSNEQHNANKAKYLY